jgi:hypothetical protein
MLAILAEEAPLALAATPQFPARAFTILEPVFTAIETACQQTGVPAALKAKGAEVRAGRLFIVFGSLFFRPVFSRGFSDKFQTVISLLRNSKHIA